MVYSIDGQLYITAFNMSGETPSYVYDINKNILLPTELKPLNVMSYNVQWFEKINGQVAMQEKIINDNNPCIIGFQEFSKQKTVPSVGQTVLVDYPYITFSNHMNYLAVVSKINLYNTTTADFVAQSPYDMEMYGETRAYIKTYFQFNGKEVCLINTHLAVATAPYIYAQMSEVFALAEQEEYVIITGDFNTGFASFYGDVYRNTFQQFVDAGYHLVNNSPDSGITKTYCGNTTATSLADFSSNPDSIIVSGNIGIQDRVFDTTKLQYLDGNPIDHIAVAATLLI